MVEFTKVHATLMRLETRATKQQESIGKLTEFVHELAEKQKSGQESMAQQNKLLNAMKSDFLKIPGVPGEDRGTPATGQELLQLAGVHFEYDQGGHGCCTCHCQGRARGLDGEPPTLVPCQRRHPSAVQQGGFGKPAGDAECLDVDGHTEAT